MPNAVTHDTDVAQLRDLVRYQQAEIDHLKLVIAKLKCRQFGRRSEQIGASEQMAFVLAELHEQSAPLKRPRHRLDMRAYRGVAHYRRICLGKSRGTCRLKAAAQNAVAV